MLAKIYPEYFASYKIYESVKNVLLKNLREADIEKIFNEMSVAEAKPENLVKKLAAVLQKHVQSMKCASITQDVKEKLIELVDVNVEPKRVEMTKNESVTVKVLVHNRTDTMLKFRVGMEQLDRKVTALLYDPVKAFCYTKIVKSHLIEPDKSYAFKFIIKPDVFGIQDIYELKKNGKLSMTLGFQAEADGVDGLRSRPDKLNVDIVKVRV